MRKREWGVNSGRGLECLSYLSGGSKDEKEPLMSEKSSFSCRTISFLLSFDNIDTVSFNIIVQS